MREIKFRCWNAAAEAMQSWDDMREHGNIYQLIDQPGSYPLMQYTGLTDRNGVEIYEGDVVQWGHIDGYIERSGARVAFVDMSDPTRGLVFNATKPVPHKFKIGNFMYACETEKAMEVIGNIHESPELLEQSK